MKVTLRKIAVLALTLVLICMFSASALAASEIEDSFTVPHSMDGGAFVVMTCGQMYETFFGSDIGSGSGDAVGSHLRIDAAYQHYFDTPSNGYISATRSTENENDWNLFMTVQAPNYRKMYSATISFDVTVPISSGSQSFSYQADTLYSAAAQQHIASQG